MFTKDLLEGKVILVSGGRSGIGYEIASQCLQLGATVFICSRNEEKMKSALDSLSIFGECYAMAVDIRDDEAVTSLASFIKETKGSLDILINNAGGQFPSLAEDISYKGWQAVVNTNLNGTWIMSQTMAKMFFIPQQKGTIINIIANIYRGFPGMAHTGAARAGVDNLTKTLAVEWSKYNICINAIAPGIIQSTGLENYPPEMVEGISQKIPLKRLGSTKDVSNLVVFLSSPLGGYITGETIYVDGGQRLWGDLFE